MQIPKNSGNSQGSALIIVLTITLILAAIAITIVFSARVEMQASRAFRERVRAQFAAEEGVEVARALLASAVADEQNQVATMPGRIMVRRPDTSEWEPVELSTGQAASGANINRVVRSGDGLRLLDPLGTDLYLNWVWLSRDGSRVVQANPPGYDASNPLVARYAFWVDDEATKVNLNTARRRLDNGYVPAQIDIAAVNQDITESDADLIFSRTKVRPLQSIREAARVAPEAVAKAVSESRLSFTHFNRSLNLNPWGDPKIILTTQVENLPESVRNLPPLEREEYFVDVLTEPDGSVDPGWNSSIDFAKLSRFLVRLNASLIREDWPLLPDTSFSYKYKSYSAEGDRRITQLGLDIVQYVRAAESSRPVTALLRGHWVSASEFRPASTQNDLFLSTGRTPLFTEAVVWVSAQPENSDGSYNARFRFEVYSPTHYNLGPLDLGSYRLLVQATGRTIINYTLLSDLEVVPIILNPGGYATITTPVMPLRQIPTSADPTVPVNVLNPNDLRRLWLRVGLVTRNPQNQNEFLDLAPAGNRDQEPGVDNSGIFFGLDRPSPSAPAFEAVPSAEVDDPRHGRLPPAWQRHSGENSFGVANSIWKTSAIIGDGSPQDLDEGVFSDFSLSFPAPKGSPDNPTGRVTSVGELGRIPSGIETSSFHWRNSVPWRTLRMQPTSTSDGSIPDWMLLELFAVPVVPEPEKEPIYFTGDDLIAGRLNVNIALEPFADTTKTETLGALFGDPEHPAIAHLLSATRASGARVFGGTDFLALPGELAEMRGVSDSGEKSEEVFRAVASQVTTSSRTFRIFSVGEAIIQPPSGDVSVTSSRTVETLVAPVAGASPMLFQSLSWQVHPL